MKNKWENIRHSEAKEERLWELYHQNSAIGRHSRGPSNVEVLKKMSEYHENFTFDGAQRTQLPRPKCEAGLGLLLAERRTATSQRMQPRD